MTVTYRWHLRQLMAAHGMFATTDLVPLLAQRGVSLSREQVYRLVTGTPERLNLIEVVVEPRRLKKVAGTPAAPPQGRRPRRARIVSDD
jgi:hypothetical protein